METLTAILVDDELLARQNLRLLLGAHPEVRVIAEAENTRQAEELIEALRPRVIFLDVQMPGGSGFDLLARLRNPPRVVFVTAYDRYALRAFEVNAVDYLLKPVEPERLAESLRRVGGEPAAAEARAPFRPDDMVLLKTRDRFLFLPLANLSLIQADGNVTHVMDVKGNCHTVRRTLKEWETLLPPEVFVALDRSTVINRTHVREWQIRGRQARLYLGRSGRPLYLGRAGVRRLRQLLDGPTQET